MELRIHDRRAVLVRSPGSGSSAPAGVAPRAELTDPADAGLGESLTAALQEWARVAASVGEGSVGEGSVGEGSVGEGSGARDTGVAPVVSRRGRQLAGRIAQAVEAPVYYTDPLDGTTILVRPEQSTKAFSALESLIGMEARSDDRVPWLTGLLLALMTAVVLTVAMLALASTLNERMSPWVTVVAELVITAGLTPSLWLGHRQLVLRWVVLGAACGLVFAWIGVLTLVL